jgi:thiamine biosynthesis protein ThiS
MPTMDGTTIELNGERRAIQSGATVRELLEVELRIAGERVAVELNRALLPRAQWDRVLAGGDRLEIVTFVGGG